MSQVEERRRHASALLDAPTGGVPRARPRHTPRVTVAQLLAAQLEDEQAPTTRMRASDLAARIPGARAGSGPLPVAPTAPSPRRGAHRASPPPAAPAPPPAAPAPTPAARTTAPAPAAPTHPPDRHTSAHRAAAPVPAARPACAPTPAPTPSPAQPRARRREGTRVGTTVTSLVVLVPAHDEEAGIADTVEGLLAQECPDWLEIAGIVVVADNCTDRTVEIARGYPVTVIETEGNTEKKAGALNEGWRRAARDADLVLTMDADTVLTPGCAAAMAEEMRGNASLGGVCARYWAAPGKGLAWRLQRLEYSRYDDLRELRSWRVSVASGAAAMYRRQALDEVAAHRASGPWDGTSLIEDYALTLDLKTAGWTVGAARDAHVLTHPPTSFRELWVQRLRWGRGGMDECLKRGWIPATRRDIVAYGLFVLSVFFRILFVTMVVLMVTHAVPFRYALIGLIPLGVMWLERVTSMWRLPGRSAKDVAIVVVLVVEDLYGFFLEFCAVVAAWRCLLARRQAW
ncbi:glycosyltransferase [Actinomycetospora termitidis]|uniref:Glycosyltransferase family 2 protein n=1 Tax=Actinomycetospora termitidis TaxID=3053470 RepID=A0ABT7M9L2_9PSEU|nr:glycosyltransferase family 2 protein [Actinomycetospora sp. Odt1-22]MDL5157336.1 glycosyltransferase family 2 protein [Actinomycetospora sp. Odt1-22]